MTSRRSFFKRLASLIAVVALAPEIAFARKLEAASTVSWMQFWVETSRVQHVRSAAYDLEIARLKAIDDQMDSLLETAKTENS